MGKHYEDLSRRGLIKLNNDFDDDNDAALLKYLTEKGDNYENIRFVESIINGADQVVDTVSSSHIVKTILSKESNKVVDTVIDAVIDIAAPPLSGIKIIKDMIKHE